MDTGHKQISKKLPAIAIGAAVIIILGLITMKVPTRQYKMSNEKVLEVMLKRNELIRPDKFMQIYYNNDSSYQFIDLRSAHEYLKGHIKGAINIPAHKLLDKESEKYLNQDKKINILYFSDQCGACSNWMILKQLGYKNNRFLQGGYDYVNKYIIEKYAPMSGDYSVEKPKYDYAKIVKETAGAGSAASSSADEDDAPTQVIIKKDEKEEEGGC